MPITESFRKINYLRISVTDRCNLRCIYCMPQSGIINKPQQELLTFEEILRTARIFTSLGISKIRLTGGEPLVRKGMLNLVKSLADIKGIEELCLTTNGALLVSYAEELKKAGLKRINISLDTLKRDKFERITGIDSLNTVLEGIDAAKKAGLYPLKLNMVVMKGINENEIIDFADFALSKGLILRFIEFMKVTPLWRKDYFIPIEEVRKVCGSKFRLGVFKNSGLGPAIYYRVEGSGILGFIKTDLNTCQACTRLRLTSTGELKICLYEPSGLFLKTLLRNKVCDEEIRDIIKARLEAKETVDYKCWQSPQASSEIYMSKVGG